MNRSCGKLDDTIHQASQRSEAWAHGFLRITLNLRLSGSASLRYRLSQQSGGVYTPLASAPLPGHKTPQTPLISKTCPRSFALLSRAGILSACFHLLALIHVTRFHTEVLDTASKEVDMKGVNISIGKADLIVDSHLRLKAGVRYGFLGRCVQSFYM